MPISETSRFKVAPDDRSADTSLREDQGWHRMDVRWLITADSMGSTMTMVGRTTMPPGVKAQHAWHRHPNAEEWELVV